MLSRFYKQIRWTWFYSVWNLIDLIPTTLSEIRWAWSHKGYSDGLEHVTKIDLSDEATRLLSDRLDRGAHIQMDSSVWAYPRKWES